MYINAQPHACMNEDELKDYHHGYIVSNHGMPAKFGIHSNNYIIHAGRSYEILHAYSYMVDIQEKLKYNV